MILYMPFIHVRKKEEKKGCPNVFFAASFMASEYRKHERTKVNKF